MTDGDDRRGTSAVLAVAGAGLRAVLCCAGPVLIAGGTLGAAGGVLGSAWLLAAAAAVLLAGGAYILTCRAPVGFTSI